MLRWQTAGESHGEALVAMIEGLPAGVRISTDDIVSALARRRLGYGRGARMKFEQDKVRLLTGVRHGLTLGSPVAIEIANTEWPKWTEVMSADALDHDLSREGRNAPLSRPRPGHADLTGMRKYGFDDAPRYWSAPAPVRPPPVWPWARWPSSSWIRRSASAP